jgi:hypothetical protein
MPHVVVFGIAVTAAVVFCIGLISPLTPSEGCPSAIALAVFVGLPFLGVLGALPVAPHPAEKGLLLLEVLVILGIVIWLLHSIGCLPFISSSAA